MTSPTRQWGVQVSVSVCVLCVCACVSAVSVNREANLAFETIEWRHGKLVYATIAKCRRSLAAWDRKHPSTVPSLSISLSLSFADGQTVDCLSSGSQGSCAKSTQCKSIRRKSKSNEGRSKTLPVSRRRENLGEGEVGGEREREKKQWDQSKVATESGNFWRGSCCNCWQRCCATLN